MNETKTARCPYCHNLVIVKPVESGACHWSWHDCLFTPASLTVMNKDSGAKIYSRSGLRYRRGHRKSR